MSVSDIGVNRVSLRRLSSLCASCEKSMARNATCRILSAEAIAEDLKNVNAGIAAAIDEHTVSLDKFDLEV